MLEPQPDDVEEAVHHSRAEVIVTTVFTAIAVVMIGIWLGCLIAGVWSRASGKVLSGSCLIIIVLMPALVASVCGMLRVVLFLMSVVASRIVVIDDPEMLPDSDDVGEHGMVEPPMQPPQVPIIPGLSSSSDGGVRAGGNTASATDLPVEGESHHRRSQREKEAEMSGEADGGVRAGGNMASATDLQVEGESHHRRSQREKEVEMSGEAVGGRQ